MIDVININRCFALLIMRSLMPYIIDENYQWKKSVIIKLLHSEKKRHGLLLYIKYNVIWNNSDNLRKH